jgi:hypothetical protein
MDEQTKLDLFHRQLETDGQLRLGRKQIEWLFSLAQRGIEAKDMILVDRAGMPDAVIMALAEPQRRTRQRRPRGAEP